MKTTKFEIEGPLLICPDVFTDARGFFVERFRADHAKQLGLPEFIQDNFSRSNGNVLRGLHYQHTPDQGKLVTVTRGTIFDVAVDIRDNSRTFGKWIGVELSGDSPQWLWIPAGFAHGFQVLSPEGADVLYKVDAPYNKSGEGGICYNDPDLKIAWPGRNPILSGRDAELPSWESFIKSL